MKNYRRLAVIFSMLSYIFSCVMCAVTAYKYRDLMCAAAHKGSSMPPEAALLYAIPFIILIIACGFAAVKSAERARKR